MTKIENRPVARQEAQEIDLSQASFNEFPTITRTPEGNRFTNLPGIEAAAELAIEKIANGAIKIFRSLAEATEEVRKDDDSVMRANVVPGPADLYTRRNASHPRDVAPHEIANNDTRIESIRVHGELETGTVSVLPQRQAA